MDYEIIKSEKKFGEITRGVTINYGFTKCSLKINILISYTTMFVNIKLISNISYRKLLMTLHDIEFIFGVPNDVNQGNRRCGITI